jgi:succinate dehydrogenase / fumarate reductase cytochrome b subunit
MRTGILKFASQMSAISTTNPLHRTIGFYEASIGKKVVMAVTGVILFGYVLGHLLGNLQIYLPETGVPSTEPINIYAAFLHSHTVALWGVRLLLLVAVVLHITASVQLSLLKGKARPVAYVKKEDIPTSYAARTMMWSGPIIAAFVVFHVLHLTAGTVLPIEEGDVRANVISGFQHPAVAIFYILAMALLCTHLYHGLWSMFQSVGLNHPRYTPVLKRLAAVFAWFVAIGNISIPVAVLAGWLT